MKKIRYGIIGFGSFAERAIMPAIRKSSNSELIAIQKRSADMAKWKAQEHGIPLFFDSPEKMVGSSDIDAVFIVSANSQHYPETVAAARGKKHVIVEKPMAMNSAEAREMIKTCEDAGVKLMVGHMLRFSPLLQRMKQIVQSGELGELTTARSEFFYDAGISQRSWLWDKKYAGGGPLFDIAVHCLDSIRFVLDDDAVAVRNLMRESASREQVEKSSMLSIRFSKGPLCSIYTSFEAPYRQAFIEFIGTKGSLSAYNFTPSNIQTVLQIKSGKQGVLEKTISEDFVIPDLYEMEISHFSECIATNTSPMISNQSSLHNQEILELSLKNSA